MTALWIILAVLLLFVILLFSHIHLVFQYTEALDITVRYWFIKIKVPSEHSKSQKKTAKSSSAKNTGGDKKGGVVDDLKKALKNRGISGFLNLLKDVIVLLQKHLKKLRYLKIHQLNVTVQTATADAAETAKLYGEACAVIYPAISMIVSACRYKTYSISVIPDFTSEKSKVDAHLHVKIRVWHLLTMGAGVLFGGIKIIKSLKNDASSEATQSNKISEGGAVNE